MNIRFGKLKVSTPKVQEEVVEKYDFPVLTMHPAPTEPKGKYRFSLNKAALALINLETDKLEFGYTDMEGNLLPNVVMGAFSEGSNKVNSVGNFFNKQAHEDFCTFYKLDGSGEVEFKLIADLSEPFWALEIITEINDFCGEEPSEDFTNTSIPENTVTQELTPMQKQEIEFNNQANQPYI